MSKPSWGARFGYTVAAAFGALVASIALPTAVITVEAIVSGDAQEVSDFALTVAEPLGLLGAMLATYGIARLAARRPDGRDLIPWIGGAAAAGMIAAALWVLDADVWTAAAAVVLPAAALLGGRRARTPPPEPRTSEPPAALQPPPPEPGPVELDRERARQAPEGGRNLF